MRTTGRVVVVGSSIIKLQEDLKPDHALPNQLHRALRLLDELGATALANQLRDPERAQSGFVAESRNFFMRFADGELLGDVPTNAAAAKLSAGVTVVLVGINFVYSTLYATGVFKSFLCRNKLHPLTHADTFLTCQSILCRLSTRNLW